MNRWHYLVIVIGSYSAIQAMEPRVSAEVATVIAQFDTALQELTDQVNRMTPIDPTALADYFTAKTAAIKSQLQRDNALLAAKIPDAG